MRLSILLLAASFALLSSDIMASPTTNGESMSSPNQVLSSETEGRRLRTSDNIEERGFNAQKFDQLMNDRGYRSTRFANWVNKNYTDRDIHNKLHIDDNPNYKRILTYYQTYIENFAPRLISS